MCGIVGIYQRRSASLLREEAFLRARDSISYRGPDEAGSYISGPIALGHRRLSIIDLAGGKQPFSTADGRYTIIFNGEIYNYKELRRKLDPYVKFRTTSDTEVLLHYYIQFGHQGLSDLNGMFAFAIWDRHTQELFLARDRFGKKPLYYTDAPDGSFIFASELKAILSYLPQKPPLNKSALTQYLLYEYIPNTSTPFESIHKLPPGSWMKISAETIEQGTWWQLYPFPTDYQGDLTHPEATFDHLLDQAVQARMVADVPVGVLLSGGIDSSTVAWYMRKHTNRLHSFSVGFQHESFDESDFATVAADSIGTQHHTVRFTLDTFHETLDTILERMDEPLADASLLPTYAVSAEAKKHVTVVLDGDGADELLFGYDTFPAYQLSLLYEKIPTAFHNIFEELIYKLPTRHTYFSLDFKLKSFLRGMRFHRSIRNQVWIGSFHDKELRSLVTDEWQESLGTLYAPARDLVAQYKDIQSLDQLSLIYLSQYLQGDILPKIDRATMYASLEARTPFLDPKLVSFILQLPQHQKYAFPKGKQILRMVMHNRIPDSIVYRKKKGFGTPIGQWLKGPLKNVMYSTLSEENIRTAGIVRPDAVSRLIKQHLSGKADHRKKLWTLMVLHWWWQRWAN